MWYEIKNISMDIKLVGCSITGSIYQFIRYYNLSRQRSEKILNHLLEVQKRKLSKFGTRKKKNPKFKNQTCVQNPAKQPNTKTIQMALSSEKQRLDLAYNDGGY